MKKILILMVVAMLALVGAVSAADGDNQTGAEVNSNAEANAGITPDSILYGLDRAAERISLALTFDAEKKAEKGLKIAEERLAEIKAMQKENKTEATIKAQEGYNYAFGKVKANLNRMQDKDPESGEVLDMQARIAMHTQRMSEVKAQVMANIQNSSMPQEQRDRVESVFDSIQARIQNSENNMTQESEQQRDQADIGANISAARQREQQRDQADIDSETQISAGDNISIEARAKAKTGLEI